MNQYFFPPNTHLPIPPQFPTAPRFEEWSPAEENVEVGATGGAGGAAAGPTAGWRRGSGYEGSNDLPALGDGGSLAESRRDSTAGETPMTRVADKSCARCRARKVKCDRRFPQCSRCEKRRESCEYKDDISIALRPLWVPATTDELSPTGQGPDDDYQRLPTVYPPPSHPHFYSPYPRLAAPQPESDRPVRSLSSLPPRKHSEQIPPNLTDLWDEFFQANIGERSVDWQLARPAMASSLTLHLLDASMNSCCSHLPAFRLFASRIDYLKEHLNSLDIPGQVIVAVLTSLGARASPHSALLGVAGPDIENANASHDLVLSAGTRRENAWRAIADRAVDLCSRAEILQVPTQQNVESLVAMTTMLMLAEAKPTKSRFFLRNVVGLFEDLQRSDMPSSEIEKIKKSVGPMLYESDARTAAFLNMPLLISDEDIHEYFEDTGVVVPDLARESLSVWLDATLDPARGPVTRANLDEALGLTGYWVCSIQRTYASISSARRSSTRFLETIPQLWRSIDATHSAVQRLHRKLVGLEITDDDGDHTLEYDLLIGVRMDARLIDIINLAHGFLCSQLDTMSTPGDRKALDELVALSERRVRKSLKLLAFYSKVFVDSRDKHLVYHLFLQLESLPSWALMAPQRMGEPTSSGPLTAECTLAETELDWFTAALELACFYTPLAATRLDQVKEGRQARQRRPTPAPVSSSNYNYNSGPLLPQLPSNSLYGSATDSLPSSSFPVGPPGPSVPSLSPYTFDSFGTPSVSLQLASPSGDLTGTASEQQPWLEGLDIDAMLSETTGEGATVGGTVSGTVQGGGVAGWSGASTPGIGGTAGPFKPFEDGGRWTSLNQW